MAGATNLKVFLLGRVAVERDGLVVDETRFPGRQGRLVFGYLVAERNRPVPRDELADAIWAGMPPASWEKALTVIVSKLRAVLAECGLDGASALTSAFGCYRLELPEGTRVDVFAATAAANAAEAELAAGNADAAREAAALATSLLQAPFLPGEGGSWVEDKRRELSDARDRSLGALAEAALRCGNLQEGVRLA